MFSGLTINNSTESAIYCSSLSWSLPCSIIKVRQTSSLHSLSTWIILYIWRYIDGQALLQVYCLVIFMDKVWVRQLAMRGFINIYIIVYTLIFFIYCIVTYSRNTCRLQVSLDMSLIIPWPCMYTHIIRLRQLRLSIVCCISDQKSLNIKYIFCIWIFVCKLDTYIIEYLYLDMI